MRFNVDTIVSNCSICTSKFNWTDTICPSVWMGFEEKALAAGKNTSKYKAYPAKVVGELLKYLEKNTSDKKSYPNKPDTVEEIKILAGVYPYVVEAIISSNINFTTRGKINSSRRLI